MNLFLDRPYEYYLDSNVSQIMRIVINDVEDTFGLLMTILSLFTELSVSTVIVVFVFWMNPTMAILVMAALTIELIVTGRFVRPKMKKMGVELREQSTKVNEWIIQAVEGIKETKVADKGSFFSEQYKKAAIKCAVIERRNGILNFLPSRIIEVVTIDVMLGIIAVLLMNGAGVTKVLPQLTAFAVATMRLLPAADNISGYINSIPFMEPSLYSLVDNIVDMKKWDKIYRINEDDSAGKTSVTLKRACVFSHVTYIYQNSKQVILDDASMEIPVGTSVGIVGMSGAGKTTAVDILLGLLRPQEGMVLADGVNIYKNIKGWLKHVSYIPQTIYLLDDTICANVAFGFDKSEWDEERVWEALREAELADFVKAQDKGLYTQVGERGMRLSGGQRQRIGIARALYTDPDMLVFDEATSSLDTETETMIMNSINALHGKKTMVIIAHRISTIKNCDYIYCVKDGKFIPKEYKEII